MFVDLIKFLYVIYFKDENVGMVVGVVDYIEIIMDGGDIWVVVMVIGDGGDLFCVGENIGGDIWWVGLDDGQMYYFSDYGMIWIECMFFGFSVGVVYDLGWSSRMGGWMVYSLINVIGFVYCFCNGGMIWEVELDMIVGELYVIELCMINQVWFVGEIDIMVIVFKMYD